MQNATVSKTRIVEFDLLKIVALLLIIFVHSDLIFVFPEIINPTKWFLVSSFFFISGFLVYNSFHSREASILRFVKTKLVLLYIPFVLFSLFYFVLQIILGMTKPNLLYLLSHLAMFNIFDALNAVHNWDFLWFIPYLLFFMLIFCVTEKYVKKPKLQILIILATWLCAILAWGYDTNLRLGMVFTQYFLVFMAGVWLNKFKMYEKVTQVKATLVAVPVAAVSLLDFSGIFTLGNVTETVEYLLYFNGRSIAFSLCTIFLVLIVLRKINVSRNRFVELTVATSILIYFMEPFVSYMIRNYVFGQPAIYYASGLEFYVYQALRIAVLFLMLPAAVKLFRKNQIKKRLDFKTNQSN